MFEIVRSGLCGVDSAAGFGETARVDRHQHIVREINWNAEQFAYHRRGDDPAVFLGEVERAARQQFVEPFVGQLADAGFPAGGRLRPERLTVRTAHAVVDRRVEVRVERQRLQRRIGHRPMIVTGQHGRRRQRALRGDERSVVDRQHIPDVGKSRQREGVPLRQVIDRVVLTQDAVVRQRVGHHRRVERIVGEIDHCSGDGGSACRIESSQPSRSAGATLIQVTISAGGLSFHDG